MKEKCVWNFRRRRKVPKISWSGIRWSKLDKQGVINIEHRSQSIPKHSRGGFW